MQCLLQVAYRLLLSASDSGLKLDFYPHAVMDCHRRPLILAAPKARAFSVAAAVAAIVSLLLHCWCCYVVATSSCNSSAGAGGSTCAAGRR